MCYPDVAEHLTSHPEIKHVLFIGSKPVAHKVAEAAAKVKLLEISLIIESYKTYIGIRRQRCRCGAQ